jgi:hypothetical protein
LRFFEGFKFLFYLVEIAQNFPQFDHEAVALACVQFGSIDSLVCFGGEASSLSLVVNYTPQSSVRDFPKDVHSLRRGPDPAPVRSQSFTRTGEVSYGPSPKDRLRLTRLVMISEGSRGVMQDSRGFELPAT